ncbi:carboxypeptidase-like regulatory domain-containing protein [Gimesia aquarii]|uniref:Carboxypeptidase regulatory-like domain-containing protein n=1 Tax=Gimesia aquarii TaxID=2527964 RepID=A0A517WX71_9PLAN|nr:carboxypeptidase-like regulatory domain-containing protein [Gimesia aquarii]QDU09860.1 hypothetical protein V202x_32570 [Gimesia aquarii]
MSVRALFITSICIFLCGCTGRTGEDRKPVYKVSGTVSLSGAPVAGANVTFVSKEKQPVAYGRTNATGLYELMTYSPGDGAAAGRYSVLVNKYVGNATETSGSDAAHGADPTKNYDSNSGHDARATKKTENAIPAKYAKVDTTPLSVMVEAGGDNKFDLEIK